MPFQLRVTRSLAESRRPASVAGIPLSEWHGRIVTSVRRHLPSAAGSLLARPVIGSTHVEWYSDFTGQPIPLERLDPEERRRAGRLLEERLTSLRDLAVRFRTSGEVQLADALELAVAPPLPGSVYVIGGQPVATNWDEIRPGVMAPAPVVTAASGLPVAALGRARRSDLRWIVLCAVALTVSLMLGLGPLGLNLSAIPNLDRSLSLDALSGNSPAAPGSEDELTRLAEERQALLEEQAELERQLGDALRACEGPVPSTGSRPRG
jgi:hypothetical protein